MVYRPLISGKRRRKELEFALIMVPRYPSVTRYTAAEYP